MNRADRRRLRFLVGFGAFFTALWFLWNTPVVYPLKIFVVLLHELSHAGASLATAVIPLADAFPGRLCAPSPSQTDIHERPSPEPAEIGIPGQPVGHVDRRAAQAVEVRCHDLAGHDLPQRGSGSAPAAAAALRAAG